MELVNKITEEQIREIAEMIDASPYICYFNSETGEYVLMMNDYLLSEHGISWDDEEDSEPEDNCPEWQKEMYTEVKADMEKINSWGWSKTIQIEKPESHESFRFMEEFANEVIPEGKLKQDFWKALSRSHPFRNFNAIVHNCKYREDWFAFKQNAMEEYVRRKIGYK